jgi:hypothetical protein
MTLLHPVNDDPQDPWEQIFSSDKSYRVEILKALLDEADIPSVVLNKQDSSYLIFGDIRLMVRRSDILRAEHILNEFLERE